MSRKFLSSHRRDTRIGVRHLSKNVEQEGEGRGEWRTYGCDQGKGGRDGCGFARRYVGTYGLQSLYMFAQGRRRRAR
jgi:hypothetical protein